MDDIIKRDLIYGAYPPKGIYFTTIVEYNNTHPAFVECPRFEYIISEPLASFPIAMTLTEDIVSDISEAFPAAILSDVDPVNSNGFHQLLHDSSGILIASIGVNAHDCRNENWV